MQVGFEGSVFKMHRFWEMKKVENERAVSLDNRVIKGGKKQKGKFSGLASQKERKKPEAKPLLPSPNKQKSTKISGLCYIDIRVCC